MVEPTFNSRGDPRVATVPPRTGYCANKLGCDSNPGGADMAALMDSPQRMVVSYA